MVIDFLPICQNAKVKDNLLYLNCKKIERLRSKLGNCKLKQIDCEMVQKVFGEYCAYKTTKQLCNKKCHGLKID